MKPLLVICLFASLLSPGLMMNCYQCTGKDCATPGIQECADDEDACFVAVVETTVVSSLAPNYTLTTKQCTPASFCMQSYQSASTLDGGNTRFEVRCCYTDLCNKMTFSLPEPEDQAPNGVVCPSCFVFNSAECQEVEDLSCTGGETKCIEEALHISVDFLGEDIDVYLRGCATPSACLFPIPDPDRVSNKLRVAITKLHCSQGSEDLTV